MIDDVVQDIKFIYTRLTFKLWFKYINFYYSNNCCSMTQSLGNVVKSILAYTLWTPVCSQSTWLCSNEMVNRLIRSSMRSYESTSDIDRKVNQCKVKLVLFWHTIELYFRYRFMQHDRTTVEPQFKGALGLF